ncbi:MAG: NAD(P)/FAD-dependent oxidoreductase [Microcoleaceae cyanobacterium]
MEYYPVVVMGGGPAGLTTAYELMKKDVKSIVIEKLDKVGGIARTEIYQGYRFDIGGHRFFTKVTEVEDLWKEILSDDFIQVPRLSRIFYQGKFYNYPLSISNTLSNLGIIPSFLILLSYLKARVFARLNPNAKLETFEDWVSDRFGGRLYRTFFKTYTEKVWGIPCDKIQAEWAAQRIQGLSLKKAVINALFGSNDTKTLIKKFDYPRLGPGMMWERCQDMLNEKGNPVLLNTKVTKITRNDLHIQSITLENESGSWEIAGDNFVSTLAITALVLKMEPPAPPEVIEAAKSLSYRDFLIVSLIIKQPDLFPDNWIYIHSPEVKVGRIQNFKNWSPEMVPDANKTCLGMEYFCTVGDEIWQKSNEELIALATKELAELGLAEAIDVEDGTVIRQPKAYPVYDRDYRQHLQVIQDFVTSFDNLQTVGRNGMHRYNNQDHSMLTAILAAKNILGEKHDLWNVNTERSYHEEFTKEEWEQRQAIENSGLQDV